MRFPSHEGLLADGSGRSVRTPAPARKPLYGRMRRLRLQWGLIICALIFYIAWNAALRWFFDVGEKADVSLPAGSGGDEFLPQRPSPNEFLIHIVNIGLAPLPAIALSSLDSILRSMPDATVMLYVTVPEAIPPSPLLSMKEALSVQIQFFINQGLNIKTVFLTDPAPFIRGTPLEGLPIRQRHLGGMYWARAFQGHQAHASDVIRAVVVFKYGGIYSDYDSLFMKDFRPLFDVYGPAIMTNNGETTHMGVGPTTSRWGGWFNGFFAFPAEHRVMRYLLDALAIVMKNKGVDCLLPWTNAKPVGCYWETSGPRAITTAVGRFCWNYPTELPLKINTLPANLMEERKKRHGFPSFVLISRKYLMPIHWQHKQFVYEVKEQTPNAVQKKRLDEQIAYLSQAYAVHMFRPWRNAWGEDLMEETKWPLLHWLHEQTCHALCNATQLKELSA